MRLSGPNLVFLLWLSAQRVASFPAGHGRISRVPKAAATNLSSRRAAEASQSQDIFWSRRRKRRAPGAPLVDSALLRFISEQKRQQSEQLQNMTEETSFLSSAASSANSTVVDDSRQSATTRSSYISNSELFDPWMGQFNRKRVAQKLSVIGVEANLALEAGANVQSLVLMRTARRRLRNFLQRREELWTSDDVPGRIIAESSIKPIETISHPEFGLDEAIDLMLEFGLSGTDIATILSHSPGVVMMMPRSTEATKADFQASGGSLEGSLSIAFSGLLMETLKLRKYDARKVLRQCPGLLTMRGSRSATEVVTILLKLGVSASAIARDKGGLPHLLSRSPSDVFRLVAFLSSDAVRMPLKSIGPLLLRREGRDLLDVAAPSALGQLSDEADEHQNSLDADLGKTNNRRKQAVDEVFRNMTSTAWSLRTKIGTKDLGKLIAANPSVLLQDFNRTILPTASYLTDDLGITKGDVPSILQLYPVLLGKSVAEMETVVKYLTALGIDRETQASMYKAFPSLLTMDTDKDMQPVVDFIRAIGVRDVASFIARLPPVLGYSIKNELIPKWEYLKTICFNPTFEVSRFPAYFSYPLERVVKTRYEYLSFVKKLPADRFPLDTVLRFGDRDFARRVAGDKDDGKVFQSFVKLRSKRTVAQGRRKKKVQVRAKENAASPRSP